MNRSRLNLAGDNDAHNHHQDSNRCRISENLDSDRLKDVESSSSLASSFTSSVSMEFDDDNLRISPSTETYDHDDEDDNDDQDREEEYLFEENILDNNLGRDWNIAMENDGWNDERMENDEDHYNNENNFQFRLDEGQDEEDIRQDYLPTFQKESIKKFRKIAAGRKKNLYAKNNFQNQIVQTNRSGLFDRKTSNHQQSRRPFQVLIQSPKFSSVSRSSSPSTTNDSNRLRNNRPNFWGNRSNLQDENGVARRSATKLNSYVAKYRSKYYFYFDLINGNYPQLVRKLSDDTEIWRMCFNIYSSGLRNNLIIHLGISI
ncbi:hypothetical protein QR98_0006030 [Sarcoptes scabiei]|uniref:Uncharacterized protein n=1 Tax=Sarcoptes scabiei TaxID=52283 RepID=A0A131ZV94_SARSC|nr:hypothetical protein QR98_0006030 [Sarcoptes scabiei]